MSTAYAIFRVDRPPAGDAQVRIFDVLWREEEAVEMVERLNALAADGQGGYAWSPVWVARRGAETPVSLTPDDRELLELARAHGALDTERPLAAFLQLHLQRPWRKRGLQGARFARLARRGRR